MAVQKLFGKDPMFFKEADFVISEAQLISRENTEKNLCNFVVLLLILHRKQAFSTTSG